MQKNFYHLFANGDDARNFIISERDFIFEFNLIGICAYEKDVTVVSFSIEHSHPHALLYGTESRCNSFRIQFEKSSLCHISTTRGSSDNVRLQCELLLVDEENYLRSVGTYSIIQPTKDGQPVMFYDYKWGSGSMYFRPDHHLSIWQLAEDGQVLRTVRYGDLSARLKRRICGRHSIPYDWEICNGLILPSNYVDKKRFEGIYQTYNCFRAFCGASNKQLSIVQQKMASARGIMMDDLEARQKCRELAFNMFRENDPRKLDLSRRMTLAMELRSRYHLSTRQLSTLVYLPESEIRKYAL